MTDQSKTTGWPDPDAPGVPLNPERDGWHWIVGWSDKLFVAEWDSDQQDYVWFDGGDDPSGMVENGWTYAGPVLTPAEADALRLAADVQATVSEMRVDLDEGFRLEIGRAHV